MRTFPPWPQHRDLQLYHDRSHYLLQTCLTQSAATLPTNVRSFIVLVTPFYYVTTISRYSNRERQKTSQALSLRGALLWSALSLGPECGCERDSRAWIRTSNHRHLYPIRKTHPNTIFAATHGLVITHDDNAPQGLYQCISTLPCIQYLHQLPQLISRIP